MLGRALLASASLVFLCSETLAAPYSKPELVITVTGKRLLCKNTITGRSRIPKLECLEVEDWENMSDRTQRGWHEWLYMDGGKCAQIRC
jgi:hypothetical protein